MRTRVRALGHPVHPMLVAFPLGLFTTAVIFDVVYAVGTNTTFSQVGFWTVTAGLIGAVLAALTGLADWTTIPPGTRARRVGLWHGRLNALAVLAFLISWLARLGRTGHVSGGGLLTLEIIALGLAGTAAWMGGELVDRLGVGIDDNANLNAPSSLHARPTT
jgi:uncharacterized membrane protein